MNDAAKKRERKLERYMSKRISTFDMTKRERRIYKQGLLDALARRRIPQTLLRVQRHMSKRNPRSIDEYVRAKKLAACVVCQKITPEIAAQVQDARKRARASVELILEWLQAEHGIKITAMQWQMHARGHHERVNR